VESEPKNGPLLEKLALALCSEMNPKPDKDTAIDFFKNAIENSRGEQKKQALTLTLQQLLVSMNREFELNPYLKYLP
jgi:hypothetical protein